MYVNLCKKIYFGFSGAKNVSYIIYRGLTKFM